MGKKEYVNIVSTKDITVLNNSQKEMRNVTYNISLNELRAPIKVGDEVGKINIYEDGNFMYTQSLTVAEDVDKVNILISFVRNLKDILRVNL